MTEVVNRALRDELRSMKSQLTTLGKEVHRLREDFDDTHLTSTERTLLAQALRDRKEGKTVSLKELERRLQ